MPCHGSVWCLIGLLISTHHALGQETPATEAALLGSIEASFVTRLSDPQAYREQVDIECAQQFPEGNLFPYVIPVVALCHRIGAAPDDEALRARYLAFSESCLRFACDSVSRKLEVPLAEFGELGSCQDQGTYVGQLTWALASYHRAGGQDPFLLQIESQLVALVAGELSLLEGKPLNSYPDLVWPFDTTVALLALAIHDRAEGTELSPPLIQRHLEWLLQHGVDHNCGLPVSVFEPITGTTIPPRGCDLSWRLALWKSLDPKIGEAWYHLYHREFWQSSIFISGFRETRVADEATVTADVDSGPIFSGIGSNASVLGLATATAYGDGETKATLLEQAQLVVDSRKKSDAGSLLYRNILDEALRAQGIPIADDCLTGFLFGDAVLLYALCWAPDVAPTAAVGE